MVESVDVEERLSLLDGTSTTRSKNEAVSGKQSNRYM